MSGFPSISRGASSCNSRDRGFEIAEVTNIIKNDEMKISQGMSLASTSLRGLIESAELRGPQIHGRCAVWSVLPSPMIPVEILAVENILMSMFLNLKFYEELFERTIRSE